MTVSPPISKAASPAPTVIAFIGGAEAPSRAAFASSLTCGHSSRLAFFEASAIANARHVGLPQSLQLVFGSSLKICRPVSAIGERLLLLAISHQHPDGKTRLTPQNSRRPATPPNVPYATTPRRGVNATPRVREGSRAAGPDALPSGSRRNGPGTRAGKRRG